MDRTDTLKRKAIVWMGALFCAALLAMGGLALTSCSKSVDTSSSTSSESSATESSSSEPSAPEASASQTRGTYTIQYNLANGTMKEAGAKTSLPSVSTNCGSAVAVCALSDTDWASIAESTGYEFLGWSYTSGNSATKPIDYTPGQTAADGVMKSDGTSAADGDTVVLYGVWKQL